MRKAGLLGGLLTVVLAATISTTGPAAPFGDIPEDAWYGEAVAWLEETNLSNGTHPGCYGPRRDLTRAEAAVFLHRFEGSPEPTQPLPFVDVSQAWALDAVAWMAETGITTGLTPDQFGPDEPVTRGQFAAFLHRYAGSPPASPHPFLDVTTSWQHAPVSWLAEAKITTGTSSTTFSPDRTVSRAELAVFLHRYAGSPSATADTSTPCVRPLIIHGTGDVNFDPGYGPNPQFGYDAAWTGLDGLFLADDLTVINLECAPSQLGSAVPKTYNFRCPFGALVASTAHGVDVANLANNHAADYGSLALVDGVQNVMAAGMLPVGAGTNRDAAIEPALVEVNGTTIAVLGFSAVGSAFRAGTNNAGIADADPALIASAVAAADEVADVVIVTIHWGIERSPGPTAADVQRAYTAIDAGADAVFGHHPHVLQAMSVYAERPIFWSLGNFVWHTGASRTAVAEVTINPDGSVAGRLIPATIIGKGRPALD